VEKIWLNQYEQGVPENIDPSVYPSLVDYANECFAEHKTKICYSNMGVDLTFKEIDDKSKAFAGFLQNTCGIEKGDRVAIMLPNLLQYPVAMFGIHKAGAVVVNVNPLYTARELNHVLKDSGAKCLLVLANFANTAEKAITDTQVDNVIVTQIGDLFPGLKGNIVNFVVKYIKKMVPSYNIPKAHNFKSIISLENKQNFKDVEVTSDDLAYLQYTGGTTGQAKGAMLTHRNMISNVLQATHWINPFVSKGLKGGIITALPLYHIFSLTANCLTFLKVGIPNILITNPRDIPGFVKELKRQPFSVMTGVNTLFNALLRNKDFCELDFTNFKFTLGGGMAVQKAVAEDWKKITGVALLEAYGLTETSPAVTINPLNLPEYNGSIGLPLPSTEIKICDDEGNELGLNTAGELYIRGPQVMKGYWQQSEMTNEVLSNDGWLKTGDVATVDEHGFIRIVDRKKDMIIVSGFNVYPNEVEDIIKSMPGVNEVAVVGVQAGARGEIVKAFISVDDKSITEEKVISHCRKQLTAYKVPKEIEFRDELPKTPVGKVLRRALRD
jgi:long-chain acyl-CoA synthetase